MPLVRDLGGGIWELRSDLRSDRTARVVLCFRNAVLVVPRVHQENTGDAHGRFGTGPAPDEGGYSMSKRNRHIGSSLDDLLKEEGILEEARAAAIKQAVAFQVQQAMKKEIISK